MHLPKYIKVGDQCLPVVYNSFPYPAAGAILNADEDNPRRIWIRDNGDTVYEMETLLHEILHLVDKEMCSRHAGMTEFQESYIEEFSRILFDCLYESELWNETPNTNALQLELEL
jgi:hypothetical protein